MTDHDLYDLLERAANAVPVGEPPIAEMIDAVARRRRVRNWGLVVVSSVVAAAVAVVVALVAPVQMSQPDVPPPASSPQPTPPPKYWQDDPTPAEAKADLKYGGAVIFASSYAFEISRLAGVEEATVNMQNKALRSAALNPGSDYEVEVQNLSTAGKATVAISKDGLCATFTVPNSNRGSMPDFSYAAEPATATAGEGNEAPTCT